MENLQFTGTDIIHREDDLLYLPSKLAGYDATLIMTPTHLHLESDDSGVFRRGLIVMLAMYLPVIKKKLQITKVIFDLPFSEIQSISCGKQGFSSNVLEVTDRNGSTYRIVVKNYAVWETLLKNKI